jgi:precorrin-3B C17-methyltransferase
MPAFTAWPGRLSKYCSRPAGRRTPEIEVEIVPGASALNTCAALVGAPLTHDFCAISLSDLLTPWPTIARRLDAVAYADFVVALYNPKSGRRTRQIVEAGVSSCAIVTRRRRWPSSNPATARSRASN